MTKFNSGTRVTLLGLDWADSYGVGSTLTIRDVDERGLVEFVGHLGNWWRLNQPGLEVVVNTDTPSEHFAKTAAKFATDPLSTEDIEALTNLGEQLGVSSFDQNVHRILNGIADVVSSKNLAYGDSALNPVRIFSKADRMEQLFVRLDDKLSRVQRGHEYPGDDTIRDIIGYCTLILIARESA